ncbi:cysteinyl-tRNA synthetase [Amaricoccus macauensis]|uniref:Cysteine--tRNA ligase n=1 Tax=Amaricoccus macauensis TaxID=57001 RepID=A0A840SK62_9RHOB|nr:cysteine--tRNA ligase [Amaricoccus macauensis]MBB5223519.1 cysteinyl-tRNA synthetase [Amaricoccus macauensis]
MTEISLYNTRTRSKAPFRPIDAENVRMYVCGPTVYDRAHIGNARPVVVFDTLFRLLRMIYGDDAVTYVRNLTDIDDKIIARSNQSGRPIDAITTETTDWYHADTAALGVLPPTIEPRATAYVPAMVAMIETLIERGHAYAAEGHVLFAVASYADYGRFAHRSLDEMQAGARVEVAPYKRDPMDFVLWKPSAPEQPGWPSPWGPGRPGWHIECSAMSYELLGESFDIHGGGIDLVFPHHENEIAQSMCAHPHGHFANVWMHNGFLNVEGEKMSKSLGNFFTVRDLLDRGIPGEVIRFVLLSTHYRQPIDWTEAKVHDATVLLTLWEKLLREARSAGRVPAADAQPAPEVMSALADDLNTPLALKVLRDLASEIRQGGAQAEHAFQEFTASLNLMGISPDGFRDAAIEVSLSRAFADAGTLESRVSALLRAREDARARRDFARADEIREALTAAGIKVMDRTGGPSEWAIGADFDPAKLEGIDA